MSDFRAVKEIWGAHSATFVDSDTLIQILTTIAEEAGLACEDDRSRGVCFFWVEDGKKFLESVKRLNDSDFDNDFGVDDPNDPIALVQNMKALADQWLAESLNPDGSLRFYVDD